MSAEEAVREGMKESHVFNERTSVEVIDLVKGLIKEKSVVLVKGSQGARMEKIVEKIVAEGIDAKKRLVRQEDEWKAR